MTTRDRKTSLWCAISFFLLGCGTLVGNPKKPGDQSEPPPAASLAHFKLPDLGIEIPAEALEEDQALFLQPGGGFAGNDRSVLTLAAARVNGRFQAFARVRDLVNAVVDAMSEEGVSPEASGETEILRFSGKGPKGNLSGKITVTSKAQAEAVLCVDQRPMQQISWTGTSDAPTKIEVLRDFQLVAEEGETALDAQSRAVIEVDATGSRRFDLLSQAISSVGPLPVVDGNGFTERVKAEFAPGEEFRLKLVLDTYETRPEPGAFEGDAYLVGRIVQGETGPRQVEFLGYSKSLKLLCAAGFDEESPTLWTPKLGEPRWCFGRPLGERRFGSYDNLLETAKRLGEIGIVSKSELEAVEIPDGLSCN